MRKKSIEFGKRNASIDRVLIKFAIHTYAYAF